MSCLQIPAIDVARSAAFYEAVFGRRIEPVQPGFEAPGLIGQWVTARQAASGAGLLAWINVDNLDAALDMVRANGGAVVELPFPDGPDRLLATVSDPGGNVGLVMHARCFRSFRLRLNGIRLRPVIRVQRDGTAAFARYTRRQDAGIRYGFELFPGKNGKSYLYPANPV